MGWDLRSDRAVNPQKFWVIIDCKGATLQIMESDTGLSLLNTVAWFQRDWRSVDSNVWSQEKDEEKEDKPNL